MAEGRALCYTLEMHFAVTIYYTIILNIFKIRQKFKLNSMVIQSTSRNNYILGKSPIVISKRLSENCRRRYILQLLYIILLFQNLRNSPKIQK